MKKFFSSVPYRRLLLLFTDVIMVAVSSLTVFIIMRNGKIEFNFLFLMHGLFFLVTLMLSRLLFKTYNSIWRFADTREYLYMVLSDCIGFLVAAAIGALTLGKQFSLLYLFTTFILSLVLVLCSRIVYRQLCHYNWQKESLETDEQHIQIAIVGAGRAGTMLLEELQSSPKSKYSPFCFFDRNPTKVGSFIHGVKVYDLEKNMRSMLQTSPIREVIIAIPSIQAEAQHKIVDICLQVGCKVKVYAYPFDRLQKNPGMDTPRKFTIRDINIEDLLNREPVSLDLALTTKLIKNRTVLITGGGGSIGSELCRQLVAMSPKKLIILDIYENTTYALQRELLYSHGKEVAEMELVVDISSICDEKKMENLFATHRPDVVFHAAAHKHVPLMEDNCYEAIQNNVFGTLNLVNTAERYGVSKFILISSDKAVNPTNVMGATKRICEMIIQGKSKSKTEFSAVRFGNVLGSNGSVLPIFARQISQGGPVTITDNRVSRFFMTISEAAQLVLQAGAMARKSEIFVLDMGKPVKIYELAETMIRLAGFIPHKDIHIKEVGLRPGEKLYEELLMDNDQLERTSKAKIFIERGEGISEKEVLLKMSMLKQAIETMDNRAIRDTLKKVVPTYMDPELVNGQVDRSVARQAAKMNEAVVTA